MKLKTVSLRRFIPLSLLSIWLLQTSATAQNSEASDRCAITVREIVAENTGGGVAAELKDVRKDLEKLSYSTYRLEKTVQVSLGRHESKTLELLGANHLELTQEGLEEGKIRLRVKLSPDSSKEKALETTLRIPDGMTFLIGGPAYGAGVLFLAFTAKL